MTNSIGNAVAAGTIFALMLATAGPARSDPLGDAEIGNLSRAILFGTSVQKTEAVGKLVARGKTDVVASLILASRYRRIDGEIMEAINTLTGQSLSGWHEAMLWQETHPEVKPHSSFRTLKTSVFKNIDPAFERFVGGDRSKPENMKIRFEEITWGGVPVDGIPALDNPELIDAPQATYLANSDLVFGVEINGDVRAYPLRIMGWHEMFNETIGGVPVALAYCTLCGAGILFETTVEGRDEPFVFGSSGFLYRSNKLMFDRQTDSLWNQFTGEPVTGPLVDSGFKLKIRPLVITTWENWKESNPTTKVLSLDTGHTRDYGSGVVYRDYFASPDLMFPAAVSNEKDLRAKDYVFGIRDFGAAKAWPISAFENMAVINDRVGGRNIVLVGDAKSRTVRAYERADNEFEKSEKPGHLSLAGRALAGKDWAMREDFLVGPEGTKLPRIAGHISYWFAWDGYLGVKSELYSAKDRS